MSFTVNERERERERERRNYLGKECEKRESEKKEDIKKKRCRIKGDREKERKNGRERKLNIRGKSAEEMEKES